MRRPVPERGYFRIGEVAAIVGVEPHVLRYWEAEFPQLWPQKTRGSHRRYSQRDLEVAVRIRQLLHDEGHTVAGARRKLRSKGEGAALAAAAAGCAEARLRTELLRIRGDLQALLDSLQAPEATAPSAADEP